MAQTGIVGMQVDDWEPCVEDEDLEAVVRIVRSMGQQGAAFALGMVQYLEQVGGIEIQLRPAETYEKREGLWLVEPGEGWYSPGLEPLEGPPCAVLVAKSSNPKYLLDIFYGDDPDAPCRWNRRYSVRLDQSGVHLRFGGGEMLLPVTTSTNWFRYVIWRDSRPA